MKKLRGELKQEAVFDGAKYCNVAAAIVGGALITGAASAYSADKSSSAQQTADQNATNTQLQMFNTTNAEQQPWIQAGSTALSQLSKGTADGGQFSPSANFNASDLNANLAPNYAFQLAQGQGAVNNANSVTGGLVSGNALKGLEDYTQGAAGSAYQQAFNNYTTNQTNAYNRLANIAGLGQTAANNNQNAGTQTGQGVASTTMAGGAAQAAGYTGLGNAFSGLGNNISSMYTLNQLTGGGLFGNGNTSGTPSSASYANNDLLTS